MTVLRTFAAAIFVALATAAAAGDYAERNVLGFSPDGAYFAFEEYGVQDGSGFPYSNIYVIETATDSWVDGSPIRVLIEGDSPPLSETRFEAMDRARPLLQGHQIGAQGRTLVHNPVDELSANPHAVAFRLHRFDNDTWQLGLTEVEMPAAGCPDMGQPFKGMQLVMSGPSGVRSLNNDTHIPRSRNCPLGYGLSEVIHYPTGSSGGVLMVIVNVFNVGFEGPDRRFIAIAARL